MDMRQLRYFVQIVESGSLAKASRQLFIAQPALSQQMARLEDEVGKALLVRSSRGVVPTENGEALYHHAKFMLRQLDQAVSVARQDTAALSGRVTLGLAPTTVCALGLPLMQHLRRVHPGVLLNVVEGLSGHLEHMTRVGQLDLAVLFETDAARRWSVTPLLEETLYLIRSRQGLPPNAAATVSMAELGALPLILPTGPHGLRSTLDAAFARAGLRPVLAAEIDSLALLMDAVDAGLGATLQPWAAVGRFADAAQRFHLAALDDPLARRPNVLCSLSDDELSPAALAARVVLADCARARVNAGQWMGATLSHHDS